MKCSYVRFGEIENPSACSYWEGTHVDDQAVYVSTRAVSGEQQWVTGVVYALQKNLSLTIAW